jgi:hypothetical protein
MFSAESAAKLNAKSEASCQKSQILNLETKLRYAQLFLAKFKLTLKVSEATLKA